MKVSVIIPVYNEREVLSELAEILFDTLRDQPYSWEILFIDDGYLSPQGFISYPEIFSEAVL